MIKLVNGRTYCSDCEQALDRFHHSVNSNRHADHQVWLAARRKEIAPRLLTLAQLKQQCRDKGLAVSGAKAVLIERLRC